MLICSAIFGASIDCVTEFLGEFPKDKLTLDYICYYKGTFIYCLTPEKVPRDKLLVCRIRRLVGDWGVVEVDDWWIF